MSLSRSAAGGEFCVAEFFLVIYIIFFNSDRNDFIINGMTANDSGENELCMEEEALYGFK